MLLSESAPFTGSGKSASLPEKMLFQFKATRPFPNYTKIQNLNDVGFKITAYKMKKCKLG